MSFSNLGLSPKVMAAVDAAGYETPTPIQEQAIPYALQGRDVLGIAQTGTGKTASFVLPMLTMLEKGRARARMPRSLILEPTRELAAQVEQSFTVYGANHRLTVALLIGGVSFDEQNKKLDRGADIVIATPGRLLDHFERGKLLLTGIEILVIDEADRMLDMGFIPDIERIVNLTPFTRQTLFFSATMPGEIQRITESFLQNPAQVEVSRPAATADTIEQTCIMVPGDFAEKRDALRRVIKSQDVSNAIVFCNRKTDVRVVYQSLKKHGFDAAELHGDMDQHARIATLNAFRNNEVTFLVASDVAARGLDIPAVSHIFNFDVPVSPEDYVHRVGRTGRAGRKGTAIMLVSPGDRRGLEAIEALTQQSLGWEGDAPDADSWSKKGGRGGRGGRGERGGAARSDKPAGKTSGSDSKSGPSRSRGSRRKQGDNAKRPAAQAQADKPADEKKPAKAEAKPQKAAEKKPGKKTGGKSGNVPDKKTGKKAAGKDSAKSKGKSDQVRGKSSGMGDNVPAFMQRPVRAS